MAMTQPTTDYVAIFAAQLDEIDKLESTPVLMRDMAVQALNNALKQGLPNSTQTILNNAKSTLGNISTGSLAANFKVIYAQMCVLAVSSLEALLKTYFANAANDYTHLASDNTRLDHIKVSLREIINNELRFGGKVGDLILDKDKPSFQDLKSIKETFKTYLDKDVNLADDIEKQLCFYFECRHVLVHKGGIVDDRFIKNTNVMNANLKGLKKGQPVEIGAGDWKTIKDSFSALTLEITKQ
jgi:hypothetical protein